jgi:hypothetical protein
MAARLGGPCSHLRRAVVNGARFLWASDRGRVGAGPSAAPSTGGLVLGRRWWAVDLCTEELLAARNRGVVGSPAPSAASMAGGAGPWPSAARRPSSATATWICSSPTLFRLLRHPPRARRRPSPSSAGSWAARPWRRGWRQVWQRRELLSLPSAAGLAMARSTNGRTRGGAEGRATTLHLGYPGLERDLAQVLQYPGAASPCTIAYCSMSCRTGWSTQCDQPKGAREVLLCMVFTTQY